MKLFQLICVGWLVFSVLAITLMLFRHEETHQTIWKYYGYNSSIFYTIAGGSVRLDPNKTVNEDDLKAAESFQAVNELVSYQYGILFIFISGSYLMIAIVIDIYFRELMKTLHLSERFEELKKLKGAVQSG